MNITLIVGALILMVMGSSPLSFAPMQAHDGVTGDINFRWRKRPNREADKALVEACYMDVPNYKNEKFTEVKEALMRGGNPNFHDKSGFTPLMQ